MKLQVSRSLLYLIETCRSLKQLNQIHAKSIIAGLPYNRFILEKITDSFLSFQSLYYAKCVLDQIQEPSIVSYNAMIKAYVQSETPSAVLSLYNTMRVRENLLGDKFTYPFVLKACAGEFAVEKGREVHGVVVRIGYDSNRFLCSSLLSFYGACGDLASARQVFDEFDVKDVVFWNAMIMVYARNEMVAEGCQIFRQMVGVDEVRPNEATVLVLISTCLASKNMKLGREIHGYVMKDVNFPVNVKIGAALVDLYAKCGYLDDARKVFKEMPAKNSVVWNSLICGNSQNGLLHEAIDLFREMRLSNVKPDRFTISCLLSTCAQMGAVNLGNWVRKFAENNGLWDVFIETSLVDMYAKCGYIGTARELFDQMDQKTVVTWNTILSGYAVNGQAESAVELFDHMRKLGVRPDSVTFLSILHACAHAGFVEEGRKYFDLMRKHYKLTPKVEHYGCMVDVLGRAGLLKEARELIERMDVEPTVIMWGALLNACSIHGDSEVAEWAAQHTSKLEALDGGSYVLLSNLYAAGQKFDGVKEVREAMIKKGMYKPPGCSMIEIGDTVHEFVVADKVHPRSEEICRVLEDLSWKLKMAGCMALPVLDEEHLEISCGIIISC
ncbi:pentatricopeptide repeat-containing protein At1g08070, chloroplastic-like [Ziziphus jujuba]|uniref:Pentatricopeptide repeat-containing protein At1g08070, chloroplastic-like n=1 Tax=Ziziphus jujuba TaxID=326968 RepID=A0A6P6GEE5_ZIZJJ|nr:pentatricopeptide repeat-containing protein At1g08070, chloroplastic-like [Ziziphus jujuba]XP_024932518.2 pentatricopeptide repeat-containing protein At1g08070, chloroplastic-like [Ziziphus jujuba]XP_024932519.2 pentatricopeptide repeat-containing protein At1g08070, chloroplastic-like [Ziziphus jujuba]XP_024932520.2 pentatricopeptide repeat-containing protein At1g08070, chloroplastic-like [Ziziphus jujuba]XP_060673631.1 pentatricopeptide repeat-containing protein At1g08070, chloroplastic-lik